MEHRTNTTSGAVWNGSRHACQHRFVVLDVRGTPYFLGFPPIFEQIPVQIPSTGHHKPELPNPCPGSEGGGGTKAANPPRRWAGLGARALGCRVSPSPGAQGAGCPPPRAHTAAGCHGALPTARRDRGIAAPAARRAPVPRDSHTQCSHA